MSEPLISVKNISIDFGIGRKRFRAVDHVSFDIQRGETLSLVGESGSGKTTVGRAILRIYPVATGSITFKGTEITKKLTGAAHRDMCRRIQMIFQDPMASLNERAKIDYIVSEGLYNFKLFKNEAQRKEKVMRALLEVGLLPEFASRFPHEFSGGQRQRIGIARALVMEPELLVADEPISALDVSIRAQVINLLNRLKASHGLSYLFIAHDLSVVRFISDRIAVIYRGRIVELAESVRLFEKPLHPYTRALLSAIPVPDPQIEKQKTLIVYNPEQHPYDKEKPEWTEAEPGHYVLASASELEQWMK